MMLSLNAARFQETSFQGIEFSMTVSSSSLAKFLQHKQTRSQSLVNFQRWEQEPLPLLLATKDIQILQWRIERDNSLVNQKYPRI